MSIKLILCASILLLVSVQVNASVISISSTPFNFVQEYDLETGLSTNTYSYHGETFQPTGAAYRGDGTVYTTGASDNISIFDTSTGEYIRRLDTGSDSRWFRDPLDMEFGLDGLLYASVDRGTNNTGIWVFDPDTGAVIDDFYSGPVAGLAFDSAGYLYVSSSSGHISKIDPTSQAEILRIDAAAAGVSIAKGLTVGADNILYVADSVGLNGDVFRFDLETGAFIDVFIDEENSILREAYDLEFDDMGRLFVSDWHAEKVLSFGALDGSFLEIFAELDSGSVNGITYLDIYGVSTVPAPPALLLFGTSLLGLIGFKWRRKAV